MRWPWQPKHTFRSGLLRIIEGLENGSIVLGPRQELAANPKKVEPADVELTFMDFMKGNHDKKNPDDGDDTSANPGYQ
jgi:hypothetical protein